jgi:murein DD-endopeptidase MepM/ murein hydrolase activator NlpD
MAQPKYYSFMIIPDGVGSPYGIKLRSWLLKIFLIAAAIIFVAILFFFIFYVQIMIKASLAEKLQKENEALRMYKYKLVLLEANMKETRAVVDRIASLAGVSFKIPELPPDSVIFARIDNPSAAETEVAGENVLQNIPNGLPLKGYMTRGYSDDSLTMHPGIDIAAAIGTPVQATAAGTVTFAAFDSTYGLTIIIEHENNISTLYGHNSELLVARGSEVTAGRQIALSGNTGKSTAPHLHYEIRENGNPVNPLKYISDHEIPNK